jgi:hypothetical protein
LDPELLKVARTEYALSANNEVLCIVSERNPSVQVNLRHLHELVVVTDGTYDDELAILIAQRKKKVDYFHFDADKQLNYCINNYVEIILSSDHTVTENQELQEPEEDKKPEPILEKHRALKHGIATTTSAKKQKMKTPSNTLAKKRKNDVIKNIK